MSQVTVDRPPARPEVGRGRADGRSTRWDDHRAERRRELARAARRAVHHYGPDVSMDAIAAHIGTSKSIVYRYFSDKSGLQVAVGELVLDAIRDALADAGRSSEAPRERLRAMVAAYLETVESSPHVYAFVTGAFAEGAPRSRPGFTTLAAGVVAERMSRLLVEAMVRAAGGPAASQPSAELWAAGAVGFVHGVVERWLADGPGTTQASGDGAALDRAELAAQVSDWLWDGVAASWSALSPASPPAVVEQP